MSTLNIHISVWKYRLYLREKGPWEWALSQRVLHYLMFFLEWRGWARADRDRLEAGIGRVVLPREHSNISWHYFWDFFYPPSLWWRPDDILVMTLPPYGDASSEIVDALIMIFGNRLFYFKTNLINTKHWYKKSEVK